MGFTKVAAVAFELLTSWLAPPAFCSYRGPFPLNVTLNKRSLIYLMLDWLSRENLLLNLSIVIIMRHQVIGLDYILVLRLFK